MTAILAGVLTGVALVATTWAFFEWGQRDIDSEIVELRDRRAIALLRSEIAYSRSEREDP